MHESVYSLGLYTFMSTQKVTASMPVKVKNQKYIWIWMLGFALFQGLSRPIRDLIGCPLTQGSCCVAVSGNADSCGDSVRETSSELRVYARAPDASPSVPVFTEPSWIIQELMQP